MNQKGWSLVNWSIMFLFFYPRRIYLATPWGKLRHCAYVVSICKKTYFSWVNQKLAHLTPRSFTAGRKSPWFYSRRSIFYRTVFSVDLWPNPCTLSPKKCCFMGMSPLWTNALSYLSDNGFIYYYSFFLFLPLSPGCHGFHFTSPRAHLHLCV